MLPYQSANRDEAAFDRPFEFEVDRAAEERIDDRVRAAGSDPDLARSPRFALLRDGIRHRLEVSAGTGEGGPTFWRLDPRDGGISAV